MQHSYQHLAQQLRADIQSGALAPGQRMPSVRVLARQHAVSVSTAVRCYRWLEVQGWVQARAKSGVFVADWKARRPAAGAPAQRAAQAAAVAHPVEFARLASPQHRMTELYALTSQPLRLGLHLASAAPQWYPCEALSNLGQRLLRSEPLALGTYPTGQGDPALVRALLPWLHGLGLELEAGELLITQGSTEALSVALRATTRAGDAVVVESPVYFGLLQMLDNLGLRAIEVPCTPSGGLSMEALEYALEHQGEVRAIVTMPSFQNPLGCAMPDAAKRRLLRLAEQHDLALIEDDVFGDLSPTAQRPTPLKAWDRHGRVVYCGSCSKSLAPGLRVGWVAGGRWHSRMASLKISQSLVTPLLEQRMLAAYLQSGALAPHLRRLREALAAGVAPALQAVARHFPLGTEVISSAGGWWLWLALPAGVDAMALLRLSVARGIAFTPGSLFSASGKFAHCLRLNIARPWGVEMEEGFVELGAMARTLAV